MKTSGFGNSVIIAYEQSLDDDTKLLSITTKSDYRHRDLEWRTTNAYSEAWNYIADTLEKLGIKVHCDIDDNYLRIFYKTEAELTAVYTAIDLMTTKIDDIFI